MDVFIIYVFFTVLQVWQNQITEATTKKVEQTRGHDGKRDVCR